MKNATMDQVQYGFKTILRWIHVGENSKMTTRNSTASSKIIFQKKPIIKRPDFAKHLKETFPHLVEGPTGAELLFQERESR